MNEQVSFTLRGRNPDVLTCIANLSNDEVFTPPELANRMLDMVAEAWAVDHGGASLWADKNARFLDPFTESRVVPGVGLKGGVCYFLWSRDHPGPCDVSTHFKDWPVSTATRPIMENGADIFIRFNEGLSILKKVMALESGSPNGTGK